MKLLKVAVLFCLTLFLTSCHFFQILGLEQKKNQYYICKINTDGTGFQKIKKLDKNTPFNVKNLYNMYVTKEEKLIFVYHSLYLYDQNTSTFTTISSPLPESNHIVSLSNDNKAYYCNNGDILCYDLTQNHLKNLTGNEDGYFFNAHISSNNKVITVLKYNSGTSGSTTLFYFDLLSSTFTPIPQVGGYTMGSIYNPLDGKIYTDQRTGLFRCGLTDSTNIQLLNYSSWGRGVFGLSCHDDHVVILDEVNAMKIFNIDSNNTVLAQVLSYPWPTPVIAKNANMVLYKNLYDVYCLNLDTYESVIVPNLNYNYYYLMSPTWDGKKIYFIVKFKEYED